MSAAAETGDESPTPATALLHPPHASGSQGTTGTDGGGEFELKEINTVSDGDPPDPANPSEARTARDPDDPDTSELQTSARREGVDTSLTATHGIPSDTPPQQGTHAPSDTYMETSIDSLRGPRSNGPSPERTTSRDQPESDPENMLTRSDPGVKATPAQEPKIPNHTNRVNHSGAGNKTITSDVTKSRTPSRKSRAGSSGSSSRSLRGRQRRGSSTSNEDNKEPNDPAKPKVKVLRDVYTQEKFDATNAHRPRHTKTFGERLREVRAKCRCSKSCIRGALHKIFPFLPIMAEYEPRTDLPLDLIAGLTVGIMHIPQGMAYGLLSNLPPVYGLYVSFFPVIIYFLFGTSKHISIGTFAVASLMVGTVVDKAACGPSLSPSPSLSPNTTGLPETTTASGLSASSADYGVSNTTLTAGDSGVPLVMSDAELQCRLGVATAVTFLTGVFQLGMGVCRMGFLTIYLSQPLTRAFTTGAAVHVFTSQIKYVFGISVQRYTGPLKIIYSYIDFFSKITTTNVATLIMSLICLILLFVTKQWINPIVKKKIKMPMPIELIMVVFGTLASALGHFNERYNMQVVGVIPTGIPPPAVPPMWRLGDVAADAVGIAIVTFAINVSLGNLFGRKQNYNINANQELVAYGLTNSVSSMFNCFASAASLSRSLVQESVGGQTQLAGLVSCGLLLVVLFAIGPLFQELPNNVLAAIIIVNLKGMYMQLADLKLLWFISMYDFCIWLVTFVAVVLLDVDLGLLVGVGFSLLTVIFRTQRPYTCILGRIPTTDIYKDVSVYDVAQELPGVKVFRFEGSLYYANAEHFAHKLYQKTEVHPAKLKLAQIRAQKKRVTYENKIILYTKKLDKLRRRGRSPDVENPPEKDLELNEHFDGPASSLTHVIVDCTTMGYIDYVGVNTLNQVIKEYSDVEVKVFLAGCKASVREMLEVAGFFKKIPRESLFLTTHDAAVASLAGNQPLLQQLKADSRLAMSMSSSWTLQAPSEATLRITRLRTQESITEDQINPSVAGTAKSQATRSQATRSQATRSLTTKPQATEYQATRSQATRSLTTTPQATKSQATKSRPTGLGALDSQALESQVSGPGGGHGMSVLAEYEEDQLQGVRL